MNIKTAMRCGDVTRWHIVRTAREQTLAEHLYRVWMLSRELKQRLNLDDPQGIIDKWALGHDLPEILMGDLPTPIKRALERKTGNPDFFKELEASISDVSIVNQVKETSYFYVVKIADCIEGWYFLHQEGVGEHAHDTKQQLMYRARANAAKAASLYSGPWKEITERLMDDLIHSKVEHYS